MKKINILWMLIGCLFLVTSCSDDDDSAVANAGLPCPQTILGESNISLKAESIIIIPKCWESRFPLCVDQ